MFSAEIQVLNLIQVQVNKKFRHRHTAILTQHAGLVSEQVQSLCCYVCFILVLVPEVIIIGNLGLMRTRILR